MIRVRFWVSNYEQIKNRLILKNFKKSILIFDFLSIFIFKY